MIRKPLQRILFIFILLVFLFVQENALCKNSDEGTSYFKIRRIGQIIPYDRNAFAVEAPEAGKLTITIRDDYSVFRILEEEIDAGESTIEWDGCGFNREKLAIQNYHIQAELSGESGKSYSMLFDSAVEYCKQALEFFLPSSGTASLAEADEWFVECKTILTGTVMIAFYPEDSEEAALVAKKAAAPGKITRYTLAQLMGKKKLEEGNYRVEGWEVSCRETPFSFQLAVVNYSPEDEKKIPITGDIRPKEGWTDAQVWEAMMKESVVVDIGYTDHQAVYPAAEISKEVLGTLHGQTQCLSVFEITDGWARIGAYNHEEGEYIEGWVPENKLKRVMPETEYGLLVDKQKQTLAVFRNGERIETLLVSTGRMEEKALYQETAAGSYLTGLHRVDYSTQGQKYDFVIQYDGGNLMHQIPYAWGGKKDFSYGKAHLGTKASHACIRIQAEPGTQSGINAYWIWTHIPHHTRVIILDDPDERRKEKTRLSEESPEYEDLKDRSKQDINPEEKPEKIIMTFCGDAALGGRENYYGREDSLMAYVEKNGMEYPFSGILPYTSTDQLTSVNLECVLKDSKAGEDKKKTWRFRGMTTYSQILEDGSVEMVNLANNHTIDYGEEGYTSTIGAIEGHTEWIGNEHSVTMEIGGHLFGFASCRETTFLQDPDIIRRDIEALKASGCEAVIYQCHWGTEYEPKHNSLQEAVARACERAGADLVIGHHPHVVQGIDYIGKMPVVYSLGNFIFGGTIDLKTYDACMARVTFFADGTAAEPQIELIPILTSSSAEKKINDYRPVAAKGEDRQRILDAIQADTPFAITAYTGQ